VTLVMMMVVIMTIFRDASTVYGCDVTNKVCRCWTTCPVRGYSRKLGTTGILVPWQAWEHEPIMSSGATSPCSVVPGQS